MLSLTIMTQETMLCLYGLFAAVFVLGCVTFAMVLSLEDAQQEEEKLTAILVGAAIFFLVFMGAIYYEYRKRKREASAKRADKYHSFVSEVNGNFPQTRWELKDEGAFKVSFTVVGHPCCGCRGCTPSA
eukprot:Skav229892  [mRNA]  locus=scaffold2151:21391:21777:- [translate_table: standard]